MSESIPQYAALDDWIAREAISFSVDSPETFNAAVDRMFGSLGEKVELLGLGEPLHGGEEILILRNRLFERLVEKHGYTAIAIESSFPRGHLVNEYVNGRGPDSYEALREAGYSHGFGRLETTRELVEWMRDYNADPSRSVKLRFYGFDSPTEMTTSDSPRRLLQFALDYLGSLDPEAAQALRESIENLLGPDADWENPAAAFDPAKSIGLSPAAKELRIATEELISEFKVRRPGWVASSDRDRYLEALQHALVARQLLNYHAELARDSSDRIARLLGLRDAMMADNLAYMVNRERGRGKVFAFAHNSHLQRGLARWQWGPNLMTWWPAGAHLKEMLGSVYAVIGTGVGESDKNGINPPEPGTLEARLTAAPGPVRFVPTHQGQAFSDASILTDLPTRTGSQKNPTYFPLTPQSLADFDGLLVLDSVTYNRGGPPLEQPDAGSPS